MDDDYYNVHYHGINTSFHNKNNYGNVYLEMRKGDWVHVGFPVMLILTLSRTVVREWGSGLLWTEIGCLISRTDYLGLRFAMYQQGRSMEKENHFSHERPWISPWIKLISNELDITIHLIASQLSGDCDVISNRLWRHQQNEHRASETRGRCVKLVVFIVIYGFVMSCKK